MKKKIRDSLFLSIFTITVFSCSEKSIIASQDRSSSEIIDFKGEKVLSPAGFPKELFDQTSEEFSNYYLAMSKSSRSTAIESVKTVSYDELLFILQKCVDKYPKVTLDNVIGEKDLKRILTDFPNLKSVSDVNNKRSVIFDYYQDLSKYDAVNEINKYKTINNLKILGSPGTPSSQEQAHLLSIPAYALAYVNAANDANHFTQVIYGNLNDNNMGNAFRHSAWNAFAIRNILTSAPASKNQAIDFTQDGTSKHEMNSAGQQHIIQTAMDLHNNMSARVWMERKTNWGIGPLRKMPDYDEIITEFQNKATIAIHYVHLVDPVGAYNLILNAHGGNNTATWNALYDNMYGPHEYLVRIE